ncbi:LysR family transcriptional regulator [Nakamurella sp. YIM 132087]|uniref:LysR family transcriptional regulator n=1 Tax=Nakamurella alba TaxID=2665158 RepID=A0A7K1FE75_9ACTN|nr:LysR family transcriptional regulator [Nakamurella alba]MTD12386.1 LysR family transcriptional regulator [Nakamurella alba]
MALELSQWRAFLTVAECGSLIKAAQVLHTDQPALSRALRRTERAVGAPLFVRSNRGVMLTDLGRRLLDPARKLVEHSAAVDTEVQAEVRRASGVLRVGAVDIYPINAAIAEAVSGLVVSGRPLGTEVVGLPWLSHPRALLARTIDIGFDLTVDGQLLEPGLLRRRPIWTETEAFAVISDRHPLAGAEVLDPRDLAEVPLHLPDKALSPAIHDLILGNLAGAGVPAPRRAEPLGTMADVIAQITAGHGWLYSAGTLGRHVPPGTVARPLRVALRRPVRFELVWHVNTDPEATEAFSSRFMTVLDGR